MAQTRQYEDGMNTEIKREAASKEDAMTINQTHLPPKISTTGIVLFVVVAATHSLA